MIFYVAYPFDVMKGARGERLLAYQIVVALARFDAFFRKLVIKKYSIKSICRPRR